MQWCKSIVAWRLLSFRSRTLYPIWHHQWGKLSRPNLETWHLVRRGWLMVQTPGRLHGSLGQQPTTVLSMAKSFLLCHILLYLLPLFHYTILVLFHAALVLILQYYPYMLSYLPRGCIASPGMLSPLFHQLILYYICSFLHIFSSPPCISL